VAQKPHDEDPGAHQEPAAHIEPAERVEELRAQIAYHNQKYHQEDAPEISDADFDALVRELRASRRNIRTSRHRTRPPRGSARHRRYSSPRSSTGFP